MALIEKSDDFLKVTVGLAVLAAGGGFGYHYGIYLPGKDREIRQLDEQKRKDAEQRADRERSAKEQRDTQRRKAYRICLADAQSDYDARWQSSCAKQAEAAKRRLASCLDSGLNEAYCNSLYPPSPAKDCSLSNALADDYDAAKRGAEERCLQEAKNDISE